MNIRNFAIIAHIDHGKSTLADRIMELCDAVKAGHQAQLLDSLELEREHGITIKLKAIRLNYKLQTTNYVLNLLDTPGHVDFAYEVSRSLASVEGALLIVDATQGVQAQTLANFNLALDANLTLIPVINKIDSPQAEVEKTESELIDLGFSEAEIIKVSARTGENVDKLLEAIIEKIPPPTEYVDKLSALIFDSGLDPYKGVIATIRIFGGKLKVGDTVKFKATGASAEILQVGYLAPTPTYIKEITAGEVGFIVTNVKDLSKVMVGDTITDAKDPAEALPGYKAAKPVVFLSFYPTDIGQFAKLKEALEKLKLNDAALIFSPETSASLGQGLRVGFLGLLHAQITQERLEREYNVDIIATSPSVNFEQNGKYINKPAEFDPMVKDTKEPYADVSIFSPQKYYGAISNLVHEKRGEIKGVENVGSLQKIQAEIPLLELLIGFYDQLKTTSSGYASLDFEITDYRPAKLVKLDILVNHEPIEGLTQIVPEEKAEEIGRKFTEKLKDAIPRQQIAIPIQAAIGGKIVARETIASFRKDVTAKLYGGDVTRKNKLLEKQKKGKKRMRRFGSVDIPQEAFLAVLKI
ncbi:elongation factor 4 [Candidatus Curtissbacteria bacterium]|nr:elongation factor 4 [Candidatus Curtissbacteria bacterium]